MLITIGNLRGLKDSSRLFGVPTYLFIFTIGAMILVGIIKVTVLGISPKPYDPGFVYANGNITFSLFLTGFAAGCTALTGVEAVSNGIPNFREPAQKNAKKVLLLLAIIVLCVFGGLSYLATLYHAIPGREVTVIAQIATQVFGAKNFMFYMVQATTAVILIIAANTAFADLPLLLSLISRDGYAPKQFTKRGKRLSFSNGIILLAISSSLLIIIFRANELHLLPLYAVGVFISFTLSQFGMFKKWITDKSKGWRHKAAINGIGATVTFIITIIIGITKFKHGAWFILILIPTFVFLMKNIKKHYVKVHNELKLNPSERPKDVIHCANDESQHVIILIEYLNKPFLKCLNYAKHLTNNIVAFHISTDAEATAVFKARWDEYNPGIPLIIKESPYRDVIDPLLNYIESEEHDSKPTDIVTIILTQSVVTSIWHYLLHKQTAFFIKGMLYKKRNIVVTTIPYIINK
jgi:amino acid transporter